MADKKSEKPEKKQEKRVKSAAIGAHVRTRKGNFYVEDTPACAKKLEALGLHSYLE